MPNSTQKVAQEVGLAKPYKDNFFHMLDLGISGPYGTHVV